MANTFDGLFSSNEPAPTSSSGNFLGLLTRKAQPKTTVKPGFTPNPLKVAQTRKIAQQADAQVAKKTTGNFLKNLGIAGPKGVASAAGSAAGQQLQGLARTAVGTPLATIENKTLTPNRAGAVVFGKAPIQTIQQQGEGAAEAHPGGFHIKGTPITLSPTQTGLGEALLSGANSIATDLGGVKGAKVGASKAGPEILGDMDKTPEVPKKTTVAPVEKPKSGPILPKMEESDMPPKPEPKPEVLNIPSEPVKPSTMQDFNIPKSPDTKPTPSIKETPVKETEQKPDIEPKTVPLEKPSDTTPPIKTSKLSLGVEAKAVQNKLADGFEGKPEYAQVNVKDQTKAAVDLLNSDPERALRIAHGQETPPEGLLPESVFTAVENHATNTKDVDLLRSLATESSLPSEATGMGQRIRMLAERDPDSAVANIQKVVDARKTAVEKRLKTDPGKAVKATLKDIRSSTPKVTKQTWGDFVESLKC